MKRWLLGVAAVVLIGFGFWYTWFRPTPPKHYILIVCDALRADHLGCYGDAKRITPNIDAFAAKNLLYKNAYSVAPWTFPSNAAMFTGLYPHEVADGEAAVLVDQAVTLAEYFKQAGYKTAGFTDSPIISKDWHFDQGFDTFWHKDAEGNRKVDEEVCLKSLVWQADNWKNKTFLLVYVLNPHEAYTPTEIPAELKGKWAQLRPTIRKGAIPYSPRYRRPVFADKIDDPNDQRMTREEVDDLHALYYGCIKDDDHRIGEILKAVGNDPETVIALVSDHGEEWLDHGGLRHREMVYPELLHIPLILHVPGKEAQTIDTQVSNLDLPLTLLELAGIKPSAPLQGRSLINSLNREGQLLFSSSYHTKAFDGQVAQGKATWIERYAVRSDKRALIHTLAGLPDDAPIPPGGRWEYYDLMADPKELKPLPADDATGEALRLQLLEFEKAAKQEVRQKKVVKGEIEKKLEQIRNFGYIGQ